MAFHALQGDLPVTTDPRSEVPTGAILNGEPLIGLHAAANRFPGYRTNSHLNASTLFRWITRGVKVADGSLVKLEAARLGNRWLTSAEAIARFSVACTATPPIDPNPQRSPADRNRAASKASQELDALGIR